jgi:alpha-tubulin suppressor-like RCC1 family protein/PKD repeat protein
MRRHTFAVLRRAPVALATLVVTALLTAGVLAAGPPSPTVTITLPADGHVTGQDTLAVEVAFRADAAPRGRADGPTGNVETLLLTVDGVEVARHQNPPQVKEGHHTFVVDLSAYPDGLVTLEAHGFQGNERAGLRGSSAPVTVVIDRSPSLAPGLARLVGTVGDDDAALVPGAMVSVYRDGQQIGQTATDAQGAFDLLIPADGDLVSVVATAPPPAFQGAATRVLTALPGGEYHLHLVLWSEEPLVLLGDPDGVLETVTLSTPDSSVMISGIPTALGIVSGSARAFSPTANPDAFPGEFATRQAGLESGLISAGFVSVNLLQRDAAGAVAPVGALRDAEGNPVWVVLRFKIDRLDWPAIQDGARFAHLPGYVDRPDRITAPLYYFDEARGDWLLAPHFGWLEDVTGPIPPAALPAIRAGTHPHDIYMAGVVDHFTFYNLDYPDEAACMVGRLIDPAGDPIPFAEVTIRSVPDGSVLTGGTTVSYFSNVIRAYTNSMGRFQVRVPRTETGPDDDWNNNSEVDTFAVRGEVDIGVLQFDGTAVFDNDAKGYRTPSSPITDGCGNFDPPAFLLHDPGLPPVIQRAGDVVVEVKQAKLVEFQITFREALDEGTGDPLFVTPPAFSGPDHAKATLLDPRIAVGGPLWHKTCGTATGFTACTFQSSTDSDGVATFTIPVLVRDDPGPLDLVEDLSGAFAYRKDRPDLGPGALEFGARNYLVAEDRKSATIPVDVHRRGPPAVEILQPDADPLVFLFDDLVTLEATGTDLNGESIDHLNLFYWSDPLQTRLIAQGRTATVMAGTAFGSGAGHGVVAHGVDFWGWLGTAALGGIDVATVQVALAPASLVLAPGGTAGLTATVTGAHNTAVFWSSDDLAVATVSNGLVTAVGPGTALITARSVVDPTKASVAMVRVEALVAAFTVTPASGDTATTFTFDGSPSTGDIAHHAWDFGDGNAGSGAVTTHVYGEPGTFTVTLTITGAGGAVARDTQSVPVGTTDPVALFTAAPDRGNPPLTVLFDASPSFHPDAPVGQIVSWHWAFGDGATGSGETVSHTYTGAGTFAVALTVTDEAGASGTATGVVHVNQAPTAAFTVDPAAGPAPLTVTVNAGASHDPDGQIDRYAWDFGDGTVVADGPVLLTHTYTAAGVYLIALTVQDDGGLTGTLVRTVTVEASELPPVATFTVDLLPDAPLRTFRFDASASFSPVGAAIARYAWDFGDGSPVIDAAPEVLHRYTAAGDYEVVLTVEDSAGRIGQAARVVTVDPLRVVAVAGGARTSRHSLALLDDGTVWAWGLNGLRGLLGVGSTESVITSPRRVLDLDDVVAIGAGEHFSVALRADGTVWTWGFHVLAGGLDSRVPVPVAGLDQVVAIAVGTRHTHALRSDGTVWGWGQRFSGQLGDGTTGLPTTVPVQVVDLDDVVAISAGLNHSIAQRSDGTLWSWGAGSSGQRCDGNRDTVQATPVPVLGLDDVVAFHAGGAVSLLLRSDGTLWGCGDNGFGQLGDGHAERFQTLPVPVAGIGDVVAFASEHVHALAIRADGSVWRWGRDIVALALDDLFDSVLLVPEPMPLPDVAVGVATGNSWAMVVLADGSLWTWGLNQDGQLGDGTREHRFFPVPVEFTW